MPRTEGGSSLGWYGTPLLLPSLPSIAYLFIYSCCHGITHLDLVWRSLQTGSCWFTESSQTSTTQTTATNKQLQQLTVQTVFWRGKCIPLGECVLWVFLGLFWLPNKDETNWMSLPGDDYWISAAIETYILTLRASLDSMLIAKQVCSFVLSDDRSQSSNSQV